MDDNFVQSQEKFCEALAKNNINILNVTEDYIFYEYQFKMKNGQTKWTKTVYERGGAYTGPVLCEDVYDIIDIVRHVRLGVE